MVTGILSHEVKDFTAWKQIFDADAARREAAGVNIIGVYNDVDNANHVTVITEFPSVEAIRGFLADPEMKAALEHAGVISVPEVKILNKAQ